jgi:drug/metabolite transporter (DMT)-like permease
MPRRNPFGTEFALAMVVLIWGANFPVLKAALDVMHPHVINAFRFIISAVVLGALYAASLNRLGHGFWAPLRANGTQIFFLGMLGFVLYQFCFILGIDLTTASDAALIMGSAPLWTAVTGFLFKTETLYRRMWWAMLMSVIGTVVVVIGGAGAIGMGGGNLAGNMLVLAAAMFWGAYTAFNKPLSRTVSPLATTFFGLMIALPLLLGLGLGHLHTVEWPRVNAWVWLAILFSGGLSTGLAYVMWNLAVKNTGASQTAVWGNLVPLLAVAGSALFLREVITPLQMLGGALILGGLFAMRRRRSAAPEAARPPV